MQMEEKYGMTDLSHYMNQRPIFPSIPQPQPQPPRDLHSAMVMLGGGGGMSYGSASAMGMQESTTSGLSGADSGWAGLDMAEIGGFDGRWTREETLTLLQIRLRLDSMFKEATHKGPLWDEVSRIMSVEHGYRRSGKKCNEKFENLYKYYKKIKGGKAGRQDVQKNYRFFSQLEAIYGASTSATLPSFKEDRDCVERKTNKRSLEKINWKTMITDYIETKMETLMEKQDAWMEKMIKTVDDRISKEEEWRKKEATRFEIVRKFRANERALMESRDSALMEALHKLTANDSSLRDQNHNVAAGWGENEITQLIQVRSSMETRFEQGGCMEEVLWEEIALTMASLGYNRNAFICKAKWDHINLQFSTKKTKDNTRSCSNLYSHQAGDQRGVAQIDPHNDGGHRILMNEPDQIIWNYYGTKNIAKGEN